MLTFLDPQEKFLLFFCSIMLVAAFIYLQLKCKEHKKISAKRISACNEANIFAPYAILFEDLSNRTFTFYYSFVIQNIIALMCDIFSLVFSVVAFINVAKEDQSIIVSLLAIVFVILTTYVKAHRRSSQYLMAWRDMESLTLETFLVITIKKDSPSYESILHEQFENVNKTRALIEKSITADSE